ncbi:MAG: hypothetical protein QM564_02460 [Bergeyella sp.]
MQRIAIIVFYFGRLPWYHNFFIESCFNNKTVDFVFFSDNFTEERLNQNIREVPFSLDEFNKLASDKLDLNIIVKSGLKICDLRPAFGLIFEDFLVGYDFWGYADTDIILGRIREFITDDVLYSYDFISVVPEYPSGFFAILRNVEKVNRLFTQSKDYKQLFTEDSNTLFEECGGYYQDVINGVNILDTLCPIETFHHLLEKNKHEISSLFEFFSIEGSPGNIHINNGTITFLNEYEVMMYHLTNYKNNFFGSKPQWKKVPSQYTIFKYSFRATNRLNSFLGKSNDFNKLFLFKTLKKIDGFINISAKYDFKIGKFRYMHEYIELGKNGSYYINNTGNSILKSTLYKNLFFIKGLNQYFFLSDKKKINLILETGRVLVYEYLDDC